MVKNISMQDGERLISSVSELLPTVYLEAGSLADLRACSWELLPLPPEQWDYEQSAIPTGIYMSARNPNPVP